MLCYQCMKALIPGVQEGVNMRQVQPQKESRDSKHPNREPVSIICYAQLYDLKANLKKLRDIQNKLI